MKSGSRLRQKPAHKVFEDVFDLALVREQDVIVADVVTALKKIRFILISHPDARGIYSAPDWLDGENIVIY